MEKEWKGCNLLRFDPCLCSHVLNTTMPTQMVAAWGGYVFVINLIGVHAGLLVLFGRYSTKLYRAYTSLYAVGTFLAMQVPVVGMTPLKSLEQLGPFFVFAGFQLIEFVEMQKRKYKLSTKKTWKLRIQVFLGAAVLLLGFAVALNTAGYFGPISSRVRGLFVKHTKTGNPLVDSVAEHQPANPSAYDQYLSETVVTIVPIGFMLVAFRYFHDSSSFLLVYGAATYFFSLKMVRLILLTAPIASVLTGIVVGRLFGFLFYNMFGFVLSPLVFMEEEPATTVKKAGKANGLKKKKKTTEVNETNPTVSTFTIARSLGVKAVFSYLCYLALIEFRDQGIDFREQSHAIGKHFANPTIIMKGELNNGQKVVVDDYRDWYVHVIHNLLHTPPALLRSHIDHCIAPTATVGSVTTLLKMRESWRGGIMDTRSQQLQTEQLLRMEIHGIMSTLHFWDVH